MKQHSKGSLSSMAVAESDLGEVSSGAGGRVAGTLPCGLRARAMHAPSVLSADFRMRRWTLLPSSASSTAI